MTNEKLMHIFVFSEETLNTNRSGKLTASQLSELEELKSGSIKAALILVPLSILITIVMAYFAMTKDGRVLNPIEVKIFSYGLLTCVGLALIWFIFNISIWNKRKPYKVKGLARHKVTEIFDSGGQKLLNSSRRHFIYAVKIGRKKFILQSESEMRAFEEGGNYAVYYIPQTGINRILSVEKL